MTIEYPIGTVYTSGGKVKRECTVIDVHHTHSQLTGERVKTRYVATHHFCGQSVVDYDVCIVTIQRGIGLMTTQSQLRKVALDAVTRCQAFSECDKWHAAFDAAEALTHDDPYAYGVGDAADWAVTEFYRVSE